MGTMQSEVVGGVTRWAVDAAHTQVEFLVKHMKITTVKGLFPEVTGELVIDAARPEGSSVVVEIGAASIDTRMEARDQHLRSADFFDVENHPVIAFRSRSIEGGAVGEGDRFRVIGDLTIRGTTREVVLEAEYEGRGVDPWGTEKIGFTAEARIDRRDFGLTWNQALEAGGVLVSNEVRIRVSVQAARV